MSLDLNYLPVLSELLDCINNILSFVVLEEGCQNIQKQLLLLASHSLSQFFDIVDISPFFECVTDIVIHVLEELQQGFLFKLIFFNVQEATIGSRLDSEAKGSQEVRDKLAFVD